MLTIAQVLIVLLDNKLFVDSEVVRIVGDLEKCHHIMAVVGVAGHLGEVTMLLDVVYHLLKETLADTTPIYLLEKATGFAGTPLVEI